MEEEESPMVAEERKQGHTPCGDLGLGDSDLDWPRRQFGLDKTRSKLELTREKERKQNTCRELGSVNDHAAGVLDCGRLLDSRITFPGSSFDAACWEKCAGTLRKTRAWIWSFDQAGFGMRAWS